MKKIPRSHFATFHPICFPPPYFNSPRGREQQSQLLLFVSLGNSYARVHHCGRAKRAREKAHIQRIIHIKACINIQEKKKKRAMHKWSWNLCPTIEFHDCWGVECARRSLSLSRARAIFISAVALAYARESFYPFAHAHEFIYIYRVYSAIHNRGNKKGHSRREGERVDELQRLKFPPRLARI